MQTPEAFLLQFFSARNALYARLQKEADILDREFCYEFQLSDPRATDYAGERILDVISDDNCAKVTTTGYFKSKGLRRLRYVLVFRGGGWLISDLEGECPVCNGGTRVLLKAEPCEAGHPSGSATSSLPEACPACHGTGWLSRKKEASDPLGE